VFHENEDRCYLIRKHVGVGSRREPLARHGDQVQATRQLVEEARVTYDRGNM
jgi:hypothetical protein